MPKKEMNRRGFLKACGIGAAAVVMPVVSIAPKTTNWWEQYNNNTWRFCEKTGAVTLSSTNPSVTITHIFGSPISPETDIVLHRWPADTRTIRLQYCIEKNMWIEKKGER